MDEYIKLPDFVKTEMVGTDEDVLKLEVLL
jgi:hypothetical protein